MWRDFFGEWQTGRLGQRRFAKLYFVACVVSLIIGLIAFAGSLAFVELREADGPTNAATLMFLIFVGTCVGLVAALFNIVVKRGRDIGIPGYVTGILYLVLFTMGGIPTLSSILLALVPPDVLGRPKR